MPADYGGYLASQINWGSRSSPSTNPFSDGFDSRWQAPALYYTLPPFPIGSSGGKNCVKFIAIDTCPLMDTYRTTAGSDGDPNRAPRSSRPIFNQQILEADQTAQLAWFKTELIAASQQCNAVVITGHHGIYSRGQHGQAMRQQDLRSRLNMPEAFQWAGVDVYLNGHDHIMELSNRDGVNYIVTGAGSDVRTNNAPGGGSDDVDDDIPDPSNPTTVFSKYLREWEVGGLEAHFFLPAHSRIPAHTHTHTHTRAQWRTMASPSTPSTPRIKCTPLSLGTAP